MFVKFNIKRICRDFKDLNKVFKRSYYLIVEKIFLYFLCVKVFSLLELDKESLMFIIFNILFGWFRWLKMVLEFLLYWKVLMLVKNR